MWLSYPTDATGVNSLRSSIAGQLRKKVDTVTLVGTVCMIAIIV